MNWLAGMYRATGASVLQALQGGDVRVWPLGSSLHERTIEGCLVSFDQEEGNNEEWGEGAITRDKQGDRQKLNGWLEVPSPEQLDDRDTVLIDGERWKVVRESARDHGNPAFTKYRLATVLGGFTERGATRRGT